MILISGSCQPAANTQLKMHIWGCSWGLLNSVLMREYGKHGRPPCVASLYGWWNSTNVGQLIVWHAEVWTIQRIAYSVTNKRKLMIISSVPVYLHANSSTASCGRWVFNISALIRNVPPLKLGGKWLVMQYKLGSVRQGLNCVVIHGSWTILNHMNQCYFLIEFPLTWLLF